MNILKKKKNLLITLCIAAMLICAAVLFGAAALPCEKNTAYAAEATCFTPKLAYEFNANEYTVKGVDTSDSNWTNMTAEQKINIKIAIPATYNDGVNGELPVTAIADNAFKKDLAAFNNTKITSLDFSAATNLKTIGANAFVRWSTSITLELNLPESVTSIGDSAFSICSGLTGPLIIPSSVESIGGFAFSGGTGFTRLAFKKNSKLATIAEYAFNRCTGLTGELIIPDSVTMISKNAFESCTGITSLKLPENAGFNTIGEYAFKKCEKLTGALIIPDSVTSIGNSAFEACKAITSLKLPNNTEFKTIGQNAFYFCEALTGALIIPDSVTSIGERAFDGATIQTCYLPASATFGSRSLKSVKIIVAKDKAQYDSCITRNIDFAIDTSNTFFTYETTVTFDANDGGTIGEAQQVTQTKLFGGLFPAEKDAETKIWTRNADGYKFPIATKLGYIWASYNTFKNGTGTELKLLDTVTDAPIYYAQYTEKPINMIDVTNPATKTTYDAFENFDPSGLEITVYYHDNTSEVAKDFTVVDGDNLQVGASTVTLSITIGGKSYTKDISITVNAIQLKKPTVDYSITYTYNGKNQTVELKDVDEKTMEVTGETTGITAEMHYINVSLKDTKNYKWENGGISDITLFWSINRLTETVNPSYNANEKVYVGGALPKISSDKDSIGTIKWDDYTLSEVAVNKSFGWTWTPTDSFNYDPVTGSINIDVLAVELESISVSFDQGETKVFTSTDINTFKNIFRNSLIVTKNFNNGTTETITESSLYTLSGTLTAGTSTVTVTVNGKTATFNVTVTAVALESISAIFNQNDTKIFTSATLDSLKSYLSVTGVNNDNTPYYGLIEYTLAGTLTAGTAIITVTASGTGMTASFEVSVTAVELASISASFTQNGTEIYTSSTLDSLKSMLTVTGLNNDGSVYTSAIEYTLEGTLTAGKSTITVKFGGKAATFDVTITAVKLERLEITANPNKTVYTAFESFDITGMVVTATFSHGTETILDYTVMDATSLQAGTTSLTVSYTAEDVTITTTVLITVNKILLEKPSASGNYTYNGSAQTVTLDGFDVSTMSITGNTATNANAYTAVITLSDTTNYAWKDNTIIDDVTLNWTIEKASYNMSGISFTDKTVKENGNAHTLTLTGMLPSGVTVIYTGTNGYIQGGVSLAGIYKITATFAVTDTNYIVPEPMTATLTVNLAEIMGTDNSSGSAVIITDDGNGIKPGTTVTVTEKPAADYKDADITLADKKQTVLQANDISLMYNGVTIQPDSSVTVRLLIKEILRGYEGLKVVYIAPNGTIQDMNATLDGDYLVFNATHFSLYAIVAPNNEKTVTPGNPLPGAVIACIVVASVLVVLILILLILFLLRKDKSQGFVAYFAGWFIKNGLKNAENNNPDAKNGDEIIKIDSNETTKPDDDLKE